MSLENLPEFGVDFPTVKQGEERFYQDHRETLEKYNIRASVGLAKNKGYYLRITIPTAIYDQIVNSFSLCYEFTDENKRKFFIPLGILKK